MAYRKCYRVWEDMPAKRPEEKFGPKEPQRVYVRRISVVAGFGMIEVSPNMGEALEMTYPEARAFTDMQRRVGRKMGYERIGEETR